MNFSSAQRLALRTAAQGIKVPWWNLGAVVQVESNGVVDSLVNGKRLPIIRYEGHYVYRRLSGAARDSMVAAKLAHPKVGGVPNPASQTARYQMIARAVAICRKHGVSEDIPYESCSWGFGQVMGSNWKDLGYASCRAFISDVCSGFDGQLRAMIAFILFNQIDDELRDGRFAGFARVYNGPGYAANKYDTKMLAAAAALKTTDNAVSDEPLVVAGAEGNLRLGSKGRRVRELQALLVTVGFTVKVDGDFGPSTRDALKLFQTANNLKTDGVYGPATEVALAKYRPADGSVPGGRDIVDLPEVKQALVGGGGTIALVTAAKKAFDEGVAELAPYALNMPWVETIQSVLVVGATVAGLAGLAYGVYGWIKSKRTVEV